MGYRLNRLEEPVFTAVSKAMLTEFGIHYRLESCDRFSSTDVPQLPSACGSRTSNEGLIHNDGFCQLYLTVN